MTYDFDEIISRKNTSSLKWNVKDGELPMWVADMDFKTAPEIIRALKLRLEHGIFGYSEIGDDWYDAYASWWSRRHGLTIDKDRLIFCTGVIPAISSTVRKLTTPNENVVIQTPVYNIFFNSILNNGCRVLENALIYENGEYRMDFEDLEKKLAHPQTTLMILCNPQNPTGKIWDKESLEKVGELCFKYGVTVIADEIHCDITSPGRKYVPFASVSDTCRDISITCMAPTKAFNIAGLQTAAVYVPNLKLYYKIWRALNTDEVAEPNAFAIAAAVAAFGEGEAWLDEMNAYVKANKDFAHEFVAANIPGVRVVEGDATYLIWLDINRVEAKLRAADAGSKSNAAGAGTEAGTTGKSYSEFAASYIREKTGLWLCEGREYGEAGEGFLRMNVACPRSVLADGLNRLKSALMEDI